MQKNWYKLKSGSDICGCATPCEGREPVVTPEVAGAVGYVFAMWLAERQGTTADQLTIAVGHDSRLSAQELKKALIHGITCADSDVIDCGLCTTPAMFMTTLCPETNADGAVMITACHQPWDRNGFRLISRDGGLGGPEIEEILRRAQTAVLPHRLVRTCDFLATYTESLTDMVKARLNTDVQRPLLGLHVVVDAGNGAGGFYAQWLSSLGADISGSQFLDPDGSFPHHIPDPESPRAMDALAQAVIRHKADLGVLFDADCDRAAIVDEKGRAIHRNRLIALISAILLEEDPGATIVTDSVTSTGLQTFISEWGGVHYRFKRGYRNVIDEAIRLNREGVNCPLAIETSGHAAFRENHFLDDGMYLVTRLMCEAIRRKQNGLTLTGLIDDLREPVESVELRLDILPEDYRAAGQSVIERVLSHTLEDPRWHLAPDNREGVRIGFSLEGDVDDAWFLLRLSVHDPVMPVHCESDLPGGVQKLLGLLYDLISDESALDLRPLARAAGRETQNAGC